MLSSLCEGMEALAVQGLDGFGPEAYGVLCDRLGRLLQRLGLERRAKPVSAINDLAAKISGTRSLAKASLGAPNGQETGKRAGSDWTMCPHCTAENQLVGGGKS